MVEEYFFTCILDFSKVLLKECHCASDVSGWLVLGFISWSVVSGRLILGYISLSVVSG